MREQREVLALKPGEEYKAVVLRALPELPEGAAQPRRRKGPGAKGKPRAPQLSLIEQQRAFRYGHSSHICVVIAGVTRYLPVAPFDMPNFTDLARVMTAVPGGVVRAGRGELWTPAQGADEAGAQAA